MKSILYTAVAGLLVLSSCSSAYRAAQTPDDVYYSPRQQPVNGGYASNDEDNDNVRMDDEGNYVTYDDGDQGDYTRRIDRFRNNYSGNSYWDGYNGSSMFMNNYYGYNAFGSPYWGGGWGSPYVGSYWGTSFSLGFGSWYNPWMSPGFGWGGGWYPNYYTSYWGNPYYPHGGWYGGGGYHYSRPYYGRVRGGNDPSRGRNIRPGRDFTTGSGGSGGGNYIRPSRGERVRPVDGGRGNNGGFAPADGNYVRPRRIFTPAPGERTTTSPNYNNNNNYSRPSRTMDRPSYNRPSQDYNSRPSRVEYSRPSAPSYSPPPSSGGSRSGGGGGGGIRPSRGGR